MKKLITIILTLLLFKPSFSITYSINDFILSFGKQSSYVKVENIEKENIDFEIKEAKNNKWKKVNIAAKLNNYTFGETENRKNTSFDDPYAEINYNIFFVSATSDTEYNFENKNSRISELSTLNAGIKKDIFDLFYSEDKYKRKSADLKKERHEAVLNMKSFSKKSELINLYKNILDFQLDILIFKEDIKENDFLLKRAQERKAYNSFFEIEDKKLKLLEIKEQLDILKTTRENKLKNLCVLAEISYEEGVELAPFPESNFNKINVPAYELKIFDIDRKINREEIKYLKRKRMGNLIPSASYDTINKDWKLQISLKKTLFGNKTNINNKNGDLEKLEIERREKKKLIKIQKEELEMQFLNLKENVDISEKKLKLQKNRYLAAKDMFDKELFSPQSFIRVKKEYKIEGFKYLKSLNLLNSFKYRMALLEDINTGIELSE